MGQEVMIFYKNQIKFSFVAIYYICEYFKKRILVSSFIAQPSSALLIKCVKKISK